MLLTLSIMPDSWTHHKTTVTFAAPVSFLSEFHHFSSPQSPCSSSPPPHTFPLIPPLLTNSHTSSFQDGDALERAASEYNQLTYALSHCGGGAALVARLRPRVDTLAGRLSDRLRTALLSGLQRRDADKLAHVLRVFATLDQVGVCVGGGGGQW